MKVSKEGLVEIASHEGIVTSPYRDSVGVWTIGIGHTANAGAPDPQKCGTLSVAEIMDIFARDIAKFEKRVGKAFSRPLTQAQFDAAVSFDYNTGGIHKATWVRQFNAVQDAIARKSFMNWSKPKEIIPRRRKERDLFFGGVYSASGHANMYTASNGRVNWGSNKRVNVGSLMDQAAQIDEAIAQVEPEIVNTPTPEVEERVLKPQTVIVPEKVKTVLDDADKPLAMSKTNWGAGITAAGGVAGTVLGGLGGIHPVVQGLAVAAIATGAFIVWIERRKKARLAQQAKAAM